MLTTKKYSCQRCGYVTEQLTNHRGNTWSLRAYNTCPKCPPWEKYPDQTTWVYKEG